VTVKVANSDRPVAPAGPRLLARVALVCAWVAAGAAGQVSTGNAPRTASSIDFARDVQPIFRQRCYGCHGPSLHRNGLRLDRRRDAMRGGTASVIGPGNSEGSRLYLRLVGNEAGTRMPPNGGPLGPDQVQAIKDWIDQGAEWPDAASADVRTPGDPRAAALIDAVRTGNRAAVNRLLTSDPGAASAKSDAGLTPLVAAAMYGDARTVAVLLDRGADPNARTEAGSTALMWTADPAIARLLLDRGADPNVRSDDGRTPILVAAGRSGSAGLVRLLLDRGARIVDLEPDVFAATPLSEAAYVGDGDVFRMLVDHGADPRTMWPIAMARALRSTCEPCAEVLVRLRNPSLADLAAEYLVPPLADGRALRALVDGLGDPRARDRGGRSLLLRTAHSDALAADTIAALVARGADVNAAGRQGETPLLAARLRGDTPIVDLLVQAGASAPPIAAERPSPKPASSARAAVERSLPLLQRADVSFTRKTGCVSCHHNALTAMTVAAARRRGFAVDERAADAQVSATASYLELWRERALEHVGVAGDADAIGYLLLGLGAARHPRNLATDAMARYLKDRQLADGRWTIQAHRPPLESNDIQATAAAMRALRLYSPLVQAADYEAAVRRAAAWLESARPGTTEERAFQLLGLTWAAANPGAVRRARRDLVAQQRADGGWSQLPSMASDAYATGQALVALRESGIAANDAAVARGAGFLLQTQLEDGSWFVRSRSIQVDPIFESGFPHGRDQWISAAATNWAATALAMTAPAGKR
jgi:ankyrin repeat protein